MKSFSNRVVYGVCHFCNIDSFGGPHPVAFRQKLARQIFVNCRQSYCSFCLYPSLSAVFTFSAKQKIFRLERGPVLGSYIIDPTTSYLTPIYLFFCLKCLKQEMVMKFYAYF